MSYTIITDSGCDIELPILEQWGVKHISMTFRFDEETTEYRNGDIAPAEIYRRMREGARIYTSSANIALMREMMEEELKQGRDAFYIGFSSGLSNTVNTASLIADELSEQYAPLRALVYDALCASGGQTMVVEQAVRLRDGGASLDELAAQVDDYARHMCHWFTVDDLEYLKRGGRVSAAAAFAAGMLNIKPVLHMDDEGHLVPVQKLRGRRQALRALAKQFEDRALDPAEEYVVSHCDSIDDVHVLEEMLGHPAYRIVDIGPVIGSHSGPGTVSLFFAGRER